MLSMRSSHLVSLLSFLIFVGSVAPSAGVSHGQVFIRFLYFNNPHGVGNNGHICEGKNIFKVFTTDECDHFFDITLQSFEGQHLARKETPATENKREIHFGGKIAGMPNPMTFRVKQMHHFHIKIRVMDEDKNSHDFVGDFVTSIVTLPVAMNAAKKTKSISRTLYSDRGLQIRFELWGSCDRYYYGENCDVKCQPQDSDYDGHYTCDALTGNKVCLKGFTGDDCLRKDHCASNPCQNGAECVSAISSFVCRCKEGYSGKTCSVPQVTSLCSSNPCQNRGVCTETSGTFRCDCHPGFLGDRCEMDCSLFCLNNGTCLMVSNKPACQCQKGYLGRRCEQTDIQHFIKQNDKTRELVTTEEALNRIGHMVQPNKAVNSAPDGLLWPYLVAVAAVIVAVLCLAVMVTLYRRRRFIVIKERDGETVAYTTTPQPRENVYISDEGSDGTFYEDIDRHLSLGLVEDEEEGDDECYSGLEPPSDFANASYGGFTSSREEV